MTRCARSASPKASSREVVGPPPKDFAKSRKRGGRRASGTVQRRERKSPTPLLFLDCHRLFNPRGAANPNATCRGSDRGGHPIPGQSCFSGPSGRGERIVPGPSGCGERIVLARAAVASGLRGTSNRGATGAGYQGRAIEEPLERGIRDEQSRSHWSGKPRTSNRGATGAGYSGTSNREATGAGSPARAAVGLTRFDGHAQ